MKTKVAMGQTEIPVPPSPQAKAELTDADKEALYRHEHGEEAFDRQASEWRRMHACNCGAKPRSTHKIGCPKAKS